MSDDPKILGFPKAEVPPEERARRLRVEVERLAGLPTCEWLLYLEDDAKKYGVSRADSSEASRDRRASTGAGRPG